MNRCFYICKINLNNKKMKNLKYILTMVAAGIILGINFPVIAQEHPSEHPSEHSKTSTKQLTIDELSDAVKIYIEKETKANNGYFPVKDGNKTLKLTLSKVHDERLSPMGNEVYFVCVDFKATDETLYDVDIFMKGSAKDNLVATETSVHKVNGKERYTWYEENGVWKKKAIK